MQGNGTAENPYLVATAADLDSIRNLPVDAHYRQVADINLSGIQWTPIMYGYDGFMGVYDGGGHKITGLYAYSYSWGYVGLFGFLRHNPAQVVEVKNLSIYGKIEAAYGGFIAGYIGYMPFNLVKITNCHVIGEIDCVTGVYLGGLFGWNDGDVIIDGCTAHINITTTHDASGGYIGGLIGCFRGSETGTVKMSGCAAYGKISVSQSGYRGGLVGVVQSYKTNIVNCEAHVDIDGGREVGGLIGASQDNLTITSCMSTGKITNCEGRNGGLVGWMGGSASILRDSYATGDIITSIEDNYYGGLCGGNSATIQNCFASGNINARDCVAGLCGYNTGSIVSSFALSKSIVGKASGYYPAGRVASWQSGTVSAYARSDMTYNGGAFPDFNPTLTGKDGQNITPEQAKMRATYAAAGWDMSGVWDIVEGHTYPYLRSERNKIFVKQNGTVRRVYTPYAAVGGEAKPCQTFVKQNGQIYQI